MYLQSFRRQLLQNMTKIMSAAEKKLTVNCMYRNKEIAVSVLNKSPGIWLAVCIMDFLCVRFGMSKLSYK